MVERKPGFFRRFSLAFSAFARIIADQNFASDIIRIKRGELRILQEQAASAPTEEIPAPPLREASPDAALQLLGLLQQEGRFIDFVQENITSFTDDEVGAAARVVHEGCRKTLNEHFAFVPVREEQEGSRVTVNEGFNATELRLTGNVVGQPPFTGTLMHRGWRVSRVTLPRLVAGHDAHIVAAAEIEL